MTMMIECSTRTTKMDDNHIEQNTERRRHWQCYCNLVSVYWRGTLWTTHSRAFHGVSATAAKREYWRGTGAMPGSLCEYRSDRCVRMR